MSIASEIARIKNNIENSYTACSVKGAYMPSLQNSNNLSSTIDSIPKETGIPRGVDENGEYGFPPNQFAFSLPPTATSIASGILMNAFKDCTTITDVDLSNLDKITGVETMEYFCQNCTNLTSVNLSNLTMVDGNSVLNSAFMNCNITGHLDLSSLQSVSGSTAMAYTFADNPNITSIDLSGLTSLPSNTVTLTGMFMVSSNPLTTLPLSSVSFTSLSYIRGTAPMRNMFQRRTGLQNVYFPAINSNTFGGLTTYFDNILNDVDSCTVHFPSNMQAVIGSWSAVQTGYGGTNITTLFDLPATT